MIHRLLAAALVLSLAACTSEEPKTERPIHWEKVDVGAEPVALAEHDGRILVGLKHQGAKVVPGAVLLNGSERKTIPVKPSAASPYSFEAIWYSIAWDGKQILGLGGASGGAHGNVRWTVWTGSTDTTLTEHPQTFDTFNGLSAGQMSSAVITPAGQALTGSWEGIETGLDAAIWLPQQNDKWLKQNSAKTPLQNTKSMLVGANFGTADGDGILLAGSQVRLAPNVVEQHAAVWRSQKLNQGWARTELPDSGNRGQAITARCTTSCVVTGAVDGKLAIWRLGPGKPRRLTGVPDIPVGDKDQLPQPLTNGSDDITQIFAQDNKIRILSGREGAWRVFDASGGIQGPVGQLVRAGDNFDAYLIAGGALWRAKGLL
ncbi:hypothetical protein HPO96_03050 [Kribbella sandramycini]|uniref:Uncharacterized protein n=1 Tax=Kribbella sandramycini TaxID=60450 RepID=A0A7Y4NYJ6_9ACTN|nr:hypothetical protein [Kribbella sandramycini]MBB6568191.1 hypothetical protein [Kribbella sandramycini]NOL39215.1 hypothetical protein [Kribbella sandramycini]